MLRNLLILIFLFNLLSCEQSINNFNSLNEPEKVVVELKTSHNTKLYLKQMTWGLTSDQRKIFVSANKEFENDYQPQGDMVFYDYDSFFYRFENDTLQIVTMKKYLGSFSLPNGLVVIQREIENVELQNSWISGRCKKQGYKSLDDKLFNDTLSFQGK